MAVALVVGAFFFLSRSGGNNLFKSSRPYEGLAADFDSQREEIVSRRVKAPNHTIDEVRRDPKLISRYENEKLEQEVSQIWNRLFKDRPVIPISVDASAKSRVSGASAELPTMVATMFGISGRLPVNISTKEYLPQYLPYGSGRLKPVFLNAAGASIDESDIHLETSARPGTPTRSYGYSDDIFMAAKGEIVWEEQRKVN